MLITAANIVAITAYLGLVLFLAHSIRHGQAGQTDKVRIFLIAAIGLHGLALSSQLYQNQALQLGFFQVPSLMFWLINALVLLSSIKKPVLNVLVVVAPLSALAILCSLLMPVEPHAMALSTGTTAHILLSLTAYSLLTIATAQALLLAYQNHQLRHKNLTGMVKMLPPLQTMEALLFELLWVGFIVLSVAIVTGLLFIEPSPEQKLAHKVTFSIVSWLIYLVLLWGRHQKGWRGNTAIRFTLGGFLALMLAYFGSKLVIEIILAA